MRARNRRLAERYVTTQPPRRSLRCMVVDWVVAVIIVGEIAAGRQFG
jgi:hypothetical protein